MRAIRRHGCVVLGRWMCCWISRLAGLVLPLLIIAVPVARTADIPIIPSYEIGEAAVSDVIAPVAFAVPNPEETKRLRELESQRAPLVFRYCPKTTAEAEAALLQAIAEHRHQFLTYMERAANRNVLDESTVNHPTFARFVTWCQARDKAFPLTME